MRKKQVLVFCLMLLFMIPTTAGAFRLERVWQKSFLVGKNPALAIESVNGSLRVEGSDGDSIEVAADIRVKAPSKSKAEHLYRGINLVAEGDSGRVSVKAQLPRVRQDSFLDVFSGERSAIRIRYYAAVPRATSVHLGAVNGDIEVSGIAGSFDIGTENGAITGRFRGGDGNIATVNGSIDVVMEEFPEGGELTVKTVNGDITLVLPESTGAELEAETVAGGVSISFPLREKTVTGRGRVKAILGGGRGKIRLETATGDISLKSSSR
jgi:DUF4097 and DUF4098 domain-containing protein YvlB